MIDSHHDIDEALVRALLREQHPDLAGRELRLAATGWSNQLWRLGEDLAVRLPRRESAAPEALKEQRWAPEVVPGLPLPVPLPVRAGAPSAHFPWHWSVVAWVPGEPADRAPITDGPHAAAELARFLRALHRPAPAGVPGHAYQAAPLRTLEVLPGMEDDPAVLAVQRDPALRAVWEDAVAAPDWSGTPVWLHGDLHPANVVVNGGTLAGVVDFGELCGGDPAIDLAAAWLLLPAGADVPFLAAYGAADEAAVRRARGLALTKALALIGIGRAGELGRPGGQPTWGPAGRAVIERLRGAAPAVHPLPE
ncbi:phosphotransferase [Streptomyces sp. JH002]|uniref:phosphotransferase n=1 Tax=Streptomyces sp. JH002 TaxID=2763259 RepID=UPI003D80023E